jgi:signal transduction histidine kinase
MSQSGKILYACEDEQVAESISTALSGYVITHADCLAMVIEKFNQFQPDVTIISEELEDGDVFTLAEKILILNPRAEIILVSPESPQITQSRVLKAGFSTWLRAPFSAGDIQQAAANCLRRYLGSHEILALMQEGREKMDSLLSQISDGVIMIGENGKLTLVNQAACDALGVKHDELIGKAYKEALTHPNLLAAIKGDSPDPSRIEMQGEDQAFYRITSLAISEIGQVITLHDISYLKELNRMKTQFVNTVSHDIRSPLTSILGYVELIKRVGEINRQQEEYISQVQESVHRITQLISEVLDLGKIESQMDKNFTKVSILEITREVLVNMQPLILQAGLNLEMALDEGLPEILGDSIQLRQAVENLMGNAIKYTPSGGTVTIRGRYEADQIIYQVEDTGLGIPLDDQPKIFEPFFRSDNVSEDTQGSGLGLAITKTVVDNHRGRIWVDSKLGQGAMFTIVLPVFHKK